MPIIYILIKIFDKKEYAEEFQKGILFTRKLKAFRKIEDCESNNRRDRQEGMTDQDHLKKTPLRFESRLGKFEISREDITQPVMFYEDKRDHSYLFCMYSINSGKLDEVLEEDIDKFYDEMKINDEIIKLGKYAVIIMHVENFIRKIESCFRDLNIECKSSLVEYFDLKNFDGILSEEKVGFCKDNSYKHQKEYRFRFEIKSSDECKKISIGDISDITKLVRVEKLNEIISFNFD